MNSDSLFAQCVTPINSFPFQEDFELNNGGWTTGGTSSDWAWGAPTKPTINAAGSGTNCWITGGLTGSFYNNGERSWLQSPCFDFTTLSYPFVKFLVFWETESQFDGANFQYSIDNGVTWNNVGAVNEPPSCLNQHWYNYSPINNLNGLGVQDGWSGTIQPSNGSCRGGNGSGSWVTATHIMPFLAGQPNVIFRFAFGAGTQCNNYDGFAIDKFEITFAPHSHAFFNYACGANNLIQFTQQATPCPDIFSWDFGDPASGGLNFDNNPNPSHVFSGPGTYTVVLTTSNSDNSVEPATAQQIINVVDVNIQVDNLIKCFNDNNGAITATVNGPGTPFTYSWNTVPVQNTASISSLAPGTYVVTVNGTNVCSVKDSVTLTQPAAIALTANITGTTCTAANGSIKLNVTGGTPAYHYIWSPAAIDSNLNENIPQGFYSVHITDANGCTKDSNNIEVKQNPSTLNLTATVTDAICNSSNGSVKLSVAGGTPKYHFTWTPAAPDSNLNENLLPGFYSVHITDANGCAKDSNNIEVKKAANTLNVSLGRDTTICTGDVLLLFPGNYDSYQWQDNSIASSFVVAQPGNYSVVVTDANGCQGTDAITVNVGDCTDLFFPSSFTPNNDGTQDLFGPKGNSFNTQFYHFMVFNRWGQKIFESNDPLKKWDGTFNGKNQPGGTYIWKADYIIPNHNSSSKTGYVVLFR